MGAKTIIENSIITKLLIINVLIVTIIILMTNKESGTQTKVQVCGGVMRYIHLIYQ